MLVDAGVVSQLTAGGHPQTDGDILRGASRSGESCHMEEQEKQEMRRVLFINAHLNASENKTNAKLFKYILSCYPCNISICVK